MPSRSDRSLALRLRFAAWIGVVLILLIGTPIWLYLLRGDRLLHARWLLYGGWFALGAACVAMHALNRSTPPDAIRLSTRNAAMLVVGGCALLQASSLAMLQPTLSDDIVRYRLDGKLWLNGISPYSSSPEALEQQGRFKPDAIDRLTFMPQVATIYLPASEVTFFFATLIDRLIEPPANLSAEKLRDASRELTWSQRLVAFRAMAGVFAVLLSALLVVAALRLGRSAFVAAPVAWSPLLTIEAAGMGHTDVLGALFLATAVVAGFGRVRTPLLTMLAVMVKPVAVLMWLPMMAVAIKRRAGLAAIVVSGLIGLAGALPILLAAGHGWFATAELYARAWEGNGLIIRGLEQVLPLTDANDIVRPTAGLVLLLSASFAAVWVYRSKPELAMPRLLRAWYVLPLLFLMLSPVVYPWYLAWALPAAVLMPRGGYTALVWAMTIGLSYQLWHEPTWLLPWRWTLAEYLPVLAVAAWEFSPRRGEVCPEAGSPLQKTSAGSDRFCGG